MSTQKIEEVQDAPSVGGCLSSLLVGIIALFLISCVLYTVHSATSWYNDRPILINAELTKKVNSSPGLKEARELFYEEREQCWGNMEECNFSPILEIRDAILEFHGCKLAQPWWASADEDVEYGGTTAVVECRQ